MTLPVFSMNMPFAALVAHGYKTLETRNGTMFQGTVGTLAALHVGRRTYPDGGKHVEILKGNGASQEDIERLTSLPGGFSRGQVVAVLELGETELSTLKERQQPEVENAVCAYGGDAGRYLTTVKKAHWLKQPVDARGQPGLFEVTLPVSALPEEVADEATKPPQTEWIF